MTGETNRTMRLLIVAIVVGILALIGMCGIGGYFAFKYSAQDNRPCKEQVNEFTDNLYSAVTLQSSAAEEAADGNFGSALTNARKAEEMISDITPPSCSDAAVDTHMYEMRAIVAFRKSLDAINEGRIDDAKILQEEATSATKLATSALQRLMNDY